MSNASSNGDTLTPATGDASPLRPFKPPMRYKITARHNPFQNKRLRAILRHLRYKITAPYNSMFLLVLSLT
jgi:hypothetical protein